MAKLNHYSEEAPRSLSDILLYEINCSYSRENGEFAPTDEEAVQGAVLGVNKDGQYVPFGTELSPAVEGDNAKPAEIADKACAVLISRKLKISEEAQPCVVIARGACVAAANLVFGKDVTDEQKKSALGQLKSLGIVPKE